MQPMIAKMILPWFGGVAAVWITAMLFFHTVLLLGYLYAISSSVPVSGAGRHSFYPVLPPPQFYYSRYSQ